MQRAQIVGASIALGLSLAILVAISAVLAGYPAYADQDPAKPLYGVWRLTAFQTQVVGEATPRESFGPHPFGYAIFTPEHRVMFYLSKPDRKPATNDAEAAALLHSMIAYTGRYRLEGDKFITVVDGAWSEILKAHEQVRYYSIAGDKLSIRTPEQPSGVFPGKRIVSVLAWQREH